MASNDINFSSANNSLAVPSAPGTATLSNHSSAQAEVRQMAAAAAQPLPSQGSQSTAPANNQLVIYPPIQQGYTNLPPYPGYSGYPAPVLYPPAGVVQYQGQPPMSGGQVVLMRTTANVPWSARSKLYPARHAIVLGAMQIICGVVSIILNAVAISIQATTYFVGHGFWCGIVAIIAGAFAVRVGIKRGKCVLVANMVMSIIVAAIVWTQIVCGATGAGVDGNIQNCLTRTRDYYMGPYRSDGYYNRPNGDYDYNVPIDNYRSNMIYPCRESRISYYITTGEFELNGLIITYAKAMQQLGGCVAVNIILMVLGLIEFVIAIWCSALACRFVCCRCCRGCCCACYKTNNAVEVAGTQYQQVIFYNGQPMVQPAPSNVTMPPTFSEGATGGASMVSPPPYTSMASLSDGNGPHADSKKDPNAFLHPPAYD